MSFITSLKPSPLPLLYPSTSIFNSATRRRPLVQGVWDIKELKRYQRHLRIEKQISTIKKSYPKFYDMDFLVIYSVQDN